MVSGAAHLTDVTVQVHHRTEKAVLVSDDGTRETAIWLPLSQIEIEDIGRGFAVITLPEWLAIEKRLA